MTGIPRRLAPLALVMVIAMVAGACASAPASPSPSPTPSASASASPSAPASASVPPSPSPTVPPSPTASPSPAPVACAVKPEAGVLPSDRVVSVAVSTTPTTDFVTFVFDAGSLSPAGPPRGDLTVAKPPFTYASSGLPIDLDGRHAIQVRFSGMSLSNDVGEPTFTGDPDISVDYPALKQAIMFDESEGIAAWYIGYDGNGCVDLVRDGNGVTVTIAHS